MNVGPHGKSIKVIKELLIEMDVPQKEVHRNINAFMTKLNKGLEECGNDAFVMFEKNKDWLNELMVFERITCDDDEEDEWETDDSSEDVLNEERRRLTQKEAIEMITEAKFSYHQYSLIQAAAPYKLPVISKKNKCFE